VFENIPLSQSGFSTYHSVVAGCTECSDEVRVYESLSSNFTI
jgi:hypothetical protein